MTAGAFAHHSFAMFDRDKEVVLTGTIREFQWTNPHAFIEINVPNDKGESEHYSIEMNSPNNLTREGWKSSMLKNGDKVVVTMNPPAGRQARGPVRRHHLPGRQGDPRIHEPPAAGSRGGAARADSRKTPALESRRLRTCEEGAMLELYHAEPMANSLKALIGIHEKGVPFTSRFVNLQSSSSTSRRS